MMQPVTHCAWKEVPATYIHTTKDKTVISIVLTADGREGEGGQRVGGPVSRDPGH